MKMQMDVVAIYSGIMLETGVEFYVARIRTKSGEEMEVPIEQEVFEQIVEELVTANPGDAEPKAPPAPVQARPQQMKVPAEQPVRVERVAKKPSSKQPPSQPVKPAAAGDDDGFSPLPEGEAEEKE